MFIATLRQSYYQIFTLTFKTKDVKTQHALPVRRCGVQSCKATSVVLHKGDVNQVQEKVSKEYKN